METRRSLTKETTEGSESGEEQVLWVKDNGVNSAVWRRMEEENFRLSHPFRKCQRRVLSKTQGKGHADAESN